MGVVQIVFSPTGGTQKVAEIITERWGQPVKTVDLSSAEYDFSGVHLQKEDIAVIAVPSFAGRVPALAVSRLEQICGSGALGVLVCVYGNRAYEDTLVELEDTAGKCGFRVIVGIAAIAEHSIMHQYAAGRPDEQDRKKLHDFADKIWKKINNGEASVPAFPGNRPYKEGKAASMVPAASEECTLCGVCAAQCPAQAIDRENPRVTDGEKCISCMRCVVQCPQKARGINEEMAGLLAKKLEPVCSVRKANELYL